MDDLMGPTPVGMQCRRRIIDGVDQPPAHGDGDLVNPFDYADVDEGDDPAGGQSQVDRPSDTDVGTTQVRPALVERHFVTLAGQVDREQRAGLSAADHRHLTRHETIRSRTSMRRSMSANEL